MRGRVRWVDVSWRRGPPRHGFGRVPQGGSWGSWLRETTEVQVQVGGVGLVCAGEVTGGGAGNEAIGVKWGTERNRPYLTQIGVPAGSEGIAVISRARATRG